MATADAHVPLSLVGREKLLSLPVPFQLVALSLVVELRLRRADTERSRYRNSAYDLTLVLRTQDDPHVEVEFECKSVFELRVEQSGGGVLGLTYFALEDVSANGQEGIRWRINETDGDTLEFQCYEVVVTRAEALTCH